ncbi:MAG: PEGA domain-containing protein [Patescibacteria group bacterium]|nr:PEGA domain-containing protein [Patescibacteria group bacterium]MDD5715119.1 PEGA domain-containing protein [Patescibacteria group bacterium]
MTMVRRRVILLTFVVAYCIIAPLLIFYAIGWRYNFHNNHIEHVGAILIETNPRGATVYLNGQQRAAQTPATIKNLLSDKYSVKLSKQGYYSWMTTISVTSSETSRITNVSLLPEPHTDQAIAAPAGINPFMISPDMSMFALMVDNSIEIFSTNVMQRVSHNQTQSKIRSISWSRNSASILAELESGIFIVIDANTGLITSQLELPANEPVKHAEWSNSENEIIFASSETATYRINLFQKTTTKRFDADQIIYATDLYAFQQSDNRINILNSTGLLATNTSFPFCTDLQVIDYSSTVSLIFCPSNSKLYIFNSAEKTLEQFETEVRGIDIQAGEDDAIYFNKHEIFKWNIQTNKKELLLRTSYEITSANSFLDKKYVLFVQNGIIRAIQAEGPERNSYDLPYSNTLQVFANSSASNVLVREAEQIYTLQF